MIDDRKMETSTLVGGGGCNGPRYIWKGLVRGPNVTGTIGAGGECSVWKASEWRDGAPLAAEQYQTLKSVGKASSENVAED
jgi:hypothetical protein